MPQLQTSKGNTGRDAHFFLPASFPGNTDWDFLPSEEDFFSSLRMKEKTPINSKGESYNIMQLPALQIYRLWIATSSTFFCLWKILGKTIFLHFPIKWVNRTSEMITVYWRNDYAVEEIPPKYLQMALHMIDGQAFYLHKLQHTFWSCLYKISYNWYINTNLNIKSENFLKWTRRTTLLSDPPSLLTASTKRSWSSSVHLNLGLLRASAWDELSWSLTGVTAIGTPSWSE